MRTFKDDIHESVSKHSDKSYYYFMIQGDVELAYTYFKVNNIKHPLLENCETWCKGVTTKFIAKTMQDIKDNPKHTPFQAFKVRVDVFFNTAATFTEVTEPVDGEVYIADMTLDPEKMCVKSDNQVFEYSVYTEREKYLGLYSSGEFTLFSEQVNHFNKKDVKSYTLYKVDI